MGKDGVAPPEPEGNRFTVCPATIYGIFPHVRFPLRLSLPPRVYSNYGRFSAGLLILCKESATLTSSGSCPATSDRQELNLHIRHTIAAEICAPFPGPSLPHALPLSYCPISTSTPTIDHPQADSLVESACYRWKPPHASGRI